MYGITSRMLALRDAPPPIAASAPVAAPTSLFVGAYLRPGGNATHRKGIFSKLDSMHRSMGKGHAASLYALADGLVARSPGLCAAGATLVVIHNLDELPDAQFERKGVVYVRVNTAADASTRAMPPNNLRFLMLDGALAMERWLPPRLRGWACAYSIDLSDVDVMVAPPCAALAADELVIGTDGCSKKLKTWLEGRAVRSGMLGGGGGGDSGGSGSVAGDDAGTASLRRYLADRTTRCIYTSAIVGGRRSAFVPTLREVAERLRANWARRMAAAATAVGGVVGGSSSGGGGGGDAASYLGKQSSRPADFYWGEDMVAWNVVALRLAAANVLSGYPHGPTNLPMYGGLSPAHWDHTGNATMGGGGGGKGGKRRLCAHSEECRHAWLRAAQGLHWFGHKASPSQRYWVMAERCRRPRRVKGGRIAGKGEWKLPARNCTVPFCV